MVDTTLVVLGFLISLTSRWFLSFFMVPQFLLCILTSISSSVFLLNLSIRIINIIRIDIYELTFFPEKK
jgi:hypothetical protein